jgi:uncharacterized membrane protein
MGIDGNLYNVFLMAHLVTATVAFGPLFFYPRLHRNGETQTMAALHMRLVFPALALMWVLGMGLAGMSDDVWELSQTWLSLSVVNWVVLMVVSWFLIRPAVADTSAQARKKMAMGTGITHLLLVVGIYLMVFKPGL